VARFNGLANAAEREDRIVKSGAGRRLFFGRERADGQAPWHLYDGWQRIETGRRLKRRENPVA
jgi:hypothetical protein